MIELQEAGTCAWGLLLAGAGAGGGGHGRAHASRGSRRERNGGSRRFLVLLNHLIRLSVVDSKTGCRTSGRVHFSPLNIIVLFASSQQIFLT